MQEGIPSGTDYGHEVVAKTLAERELSLPHVSPSLSPFLLRVRLPEVGCWDAFRGSGIALQATGDMTRVILRHPENMYYDIPDVPEGTGTGLGPGILW